MKDHSKIRSGFNSLSNVYDPLSHLFFGRSLLRSQTHFLPEIAKFEHVLIFGGGTGKILIECLENKIGATYTYMDISEKMVARTRTRLERYIQTNSLYEKTTFICGSYADIPGAKKFDLIITPYVLDCFTEEALALAMRSLSERLSAEGKWLFVDFNIPEKGMMNLFSRSIIRMLYFFFNLICRLGIKELPPFEKYFEELHFKKEKEKLFLKGMLCARVYARS